MFDQDSTSSSVVRSLIGIFVFRSNVVSKVYQHRSRNGGILEVHSFELCIVELTRVDCSLIDVEFEKEKKNTLRLGS